MEREAKIDLNPHLTIHAGDLRSGTSTHVHIDPSMIAMKFSPGSKICMDYAEIIHWLLAIENAFLIGGRSCRCHVPTESRALRCVPRL